MADAIALVPPNNEEAEQAVLGCLLVDSGLVPLVQSRIAPGDMYRRAHQLLLGGIYEVSATGQRADVITLQNHLGSKLEEAGGWGYLVDLASAVPTTAYAEYYTAIVADKALARRLRQHGQRVINITTEEIPASEMRDKITASLIAVPSTRESSLERIQAIGERFVVETGERMDAGRVLNGCLSWDMYDLDNAFMPSAGELVIIAGRPAMGKTAFAFQLARIIAKRAPVLAYSLEMSKQQLYMRFVQEITGISVARQRGSLSYDEYRAIVDAHALLADLDLRIDDRSDVTPESIKADALAIKAQGEHVPLIVVDYMQLMRSPRGRRAENRTQEMGEISTGLKGVARDLETVVFALSQLSRAVESRTDKRPILSDLRESGQIEQDADIVLFLYRDEYYNPKSQDKGIAEVLVSKNRFGPVGVVKLLFEAERTHFSVPEFQAPSYEEEIV